MLTWMGLVVVAALPSFSAPAQLVDIETSPSALYAPRLIDATNEGVLYASLTPDGGMAVWWSDWDGAPRALMAFPDGGVVSRQLPGAFILFTNLGTQVDVSRLTLAPEPALEPLTTTSAVTSFPDSDSTSSVWWTGPAGTFATDGTPGGTRLVAPAFPTRDAIVALGERLYFADGGNLVAWEQGTFTQLGPVPQGFVRAGHHVVVVGPTLRNEAGEELLDGGACGFAIGGDNAWLGCASADGGSDLFLSDGTSTGTTLRFQLGLFGGFRAASPDYALFKHGFALEALARAGTTTPVQLAEDCLFEATIHGDAVACLHSVGSLQSEVHQDLARVEVSRTAGRRAIVQVEGQPRFLLSDGTPAGTRAVPEQLPPGPTASSSPRLLSADGVNALYGTSQGVWMTDGTPSGTRRVGDSAEFFGHSVLASDSGFVVFTREGKSWRPPDGTIGVAGGLLVGHTDCEAFSVDEGQARRRLSLPGCVTAVQAGKDGALLLADQGIAWLLRAGHAPWRLGPDVRIEKGVHCGGTRCWFVRKFGEPFELNRIELDTGKVASVVSRPSEFTVTGASQDVVVLHSEQFGEPAFVAARADGSLTNVEGLPTAFTRDGTLVSVRADQLAALSAAGETTLPLMCPEPVGVSVTGSRINVLCRGRDDQNTLWTGALDQGMQEVVISGFTPLQLPSGGEVSAFPVRSATGEDALVITDRTDQLLLKGGLSGGAFAEVRGGLVFAGTRSFPVDPELWVLPFSQRPCGCDAGGGALGLVGLCWLAVRRRR